MNGKVARIENAFIENAQYNLSVREQKTILYLIAGIDPRKKNFERVSVPVKELEAVLKQDGKKWGGLYVEMKKFARRISQKQITFPSDVIIDGQALDGYINWFAHVRPMKNKFGEVCIEFEFASILRSFLLNLKEFVQIDRTEVADMKHFYSIRLYQLFKSLYQKQAKYKTVVKKTYDLERLRSLLNLEEKYPEFKSFSQFVLRPAIKEINDQTSLHITPEYLRNTRRMVTAITFKISSKTDMPAQLSLLKQSLRLSRSEMSPPEIKRRLKQFDYDVFKRKYGTQYRKNSKDMKGKFPGDVDSSHRSFKNAVFNACETWFIENIAI